MGAGRGVRFFVLTSILWLGVVTVGCARNPNQPGDLPLRQSVELRAGSSATLEGGLTIAFDRVTSDSRCPMNAFCVWAGDAILAVSLSQGPGGRVAREFHTYPTGSDVSYLAYTIKLLVLAPYPQTNRAIPPGDYVAALEVTAR
jgi:hypothetical protein